MWVVNWDVVTLFAQIPHSQTHRIEKKTYMRLVVTAIFLLWIVLWAIFSLVLLGITALLDILLGHKERTLTLRTSYLVARVVYLTCPMWRVKVEGKENLAEGKPYVITANHQSFFDIPLMFFIPNNRGFNFVSKIEVRKIPAIGWMLGLRDDIVIRRGTASAATCVMDEGTEHLQGGTSVVIFPEGTRSKDNKVHLFKDGAFKLARANNVGIVPCVIVGTRGLLTKRGAATRTLILRILPPIEAEQVQQFATARDLAQHVQALTAENFEEMQGRKA